MRVLTLVGLLAVFGAGMVAGRMTLSPARAETQSSSPTNPYASMLHVGIVVKDLDKAVARWKAMGFTDIRVSLPNKGVDRMYHGKPINVTLKQAFIHGTSPLIELMEPVEDVPNPWGDYLRQHGEALHHLAYRVPESGPELEKFKRLGIEEIAEGKWPEGKDRWGTFQYVQDPQGGAIIEFISRIPRK
jgi:catechol 2,3-dioxygenase-like lactoylglutathione lyase family enzyme